MTYPTDNELRDWVGLGATDAQLTAARLAAIGYIERYTDRVFVAASATRKFPAASPWLRGLDLLTFSDFVSVTAVVNGDGETLPSSAYYLMGVHPPYYAIRLTRESAKAWRGSALEQVSVTASWGYSAACPDAVKWAIFELGKSFYMARQSATGGPVTSASRQAGLVQMSGVIPDNIADVLATFRRYSG
jgi:hypothetical protein